MEILKKLEGLIFQNRLTVWVYFFVINLPMTILTFDTTNWSDDYQLANLWAVKVKISPWFPLMFEAIGGEAQGGHFAFIHNVFNTFFTFFTVDPRFFHFQVLLFFVSTAFVVYLIARQWYKDQHLALLAGTLFAVNYYTAFKSLNWNIFNYNATNAFTGAVSLYCLLRYFDLKRKRYILGAAFFLFLSIHNLESGMVFIPVLGLTLIYAWLKRLIRLKEAVAISLVIVLTVLTYPIGAYLSTKQLVPMGHRLKRERNIQNHAFNANELLFKSLGLSVFYNQLIFNPLKQDPQLKESVVQLIKENKEEAWKEIPVSKIIGLAVLFALTFLFIIFLLVLIKKRIQEKTWLFVICWASLFVIYVFVFYRVDIANAIAIFSSIVLADLLMSFLRDPQPAAKRMGWVLAGVYLIGTVWTIADRFDDCYQKSFFGIKKITVQGPDLLYREINRKIGHFLADGFILFTHDHSRYHRTIGFERIGDMLSITDFLCYNATVFYKDLLKTNIPQEQKHKKFADFIQYFEPNSKNQRVLVNSKQEAMQYLKSNHVDLSKVEAIYVSETYNVERLNEH